MCKYDNVDLIVIKTENKIDFVKNVKLKKNVNRRNRNIKPLKSLIPSFSYKLRQKKKIHKNHNNDKSTQKRRRIDTQKPHMKNIRTGRDN